MCNHFAVNVLFMTSPALNFFLTNDTLSQPGGRCCAAGGGDEQLARGTALDRGLVQRISVNLCAFLPIKKSIVEDRISTAVVRHTSTHTRSSDVSSNLVRGEKDWVLSNRKVDVRYVGFVDASRRVAFSFSRMDFEGLLLRRGRVFLKNGFGTFGTFLSFCVSHATPSTSLPFCSLTH